jgi:hypothetical protein
LPDCEFPAQQRAPLVAIDRSDPRKCARLIFFLFFFLACTDCALECSCFVLAERSGFGKEDFCSSGPVADRFHDFHDLRTRAESAAQFVGQNRTQYARISAVGERCCRRANKNAVTADAA